MKDKLRAMLRGKTWSSFWQETRWIYRYVRSYRRSICLFLLLSLLSIGLGLGTTLASKAFFDLIAGHLQGASVENQAIVTTGALCVSLAVCNIALSAVNKWWTAKISTTVANEIRADVYQKILMTDLESLQAFHSGDLLNRVNNDVSEVASSVLGWIPSLITRSVQFLASLGVILVYDPTMAVLALLGAPVTLLVSQTLMKKMRTHQLNLRQVTSRSMALHEESLQNVQHIKALNLQGIFYRRILGVQKDFFDATMQYQRFSILTSLLMSGMGLIVSYACLGWAAYRMWIGAISFGTMVLFLQVSSYLSSAFSALVGLVPSAISATVSARRLMSVLELPREDEAEAGAAQHLCGQPLTLVLDKLQFSYQNGTPILQLLSLTVHPGERIAFVGRSGSGKTTLFRVMLGLLHPQQGRAVVQCGERELKLSASTRCLFAYVPQDCLMFSGTIAESLRLVRPDATDEALWNVLETACAAEFVRKLPEGLNSTLRERGSSLSGGQVQRLVLARALLTEAPILLLDEVTAALDLETERQVLANISRAYAGRILLIATHRPSALALCDRIYRFEDGMLKEDKA